MKANLQKDTTDQQATTAHPQESKETLPYHHFIGKYKDTRAANLPSV